MSDPTFDGMHPDLDRCDLSSLVALRALGALGPAGEWVAVGPLGERVHEDYAALGSDPEVGMGLLLPPWEVTAHPTPEAEDYIHTHVVPLLVSRGLVEVDGETVRLSPGLLAGTPDVAAEVER